MYFKILFPTVSKDHIEMGKSMAQCARYNGTL